MNEQRPEDEEEIPRILGPFREPGESDESFAARIREDWGMAPIDGEIVNCDICGVVEVKRPETICTFCYNCVYYIGNTPLPTIAEFRRMNPVDATNVLKRTVGAPRSEDIPSLHQHNNEHGVAYRDRLDALYEADQRTRCRREQEKERVKRGEEQGVHVLDKPFDRFKSIRKNKRQ